MENKSIGLNPNLNREVLEALGITNPELKTQTHGLSHKEMKELQYKQGTGTVGKIKANRNDDYEIDEHEAHLVHVLLDDDIWEKGKKLSIPRVAKFYKDDFDKMSKTEVEEVDGKKKYPENAFAQWKTEIIHYPDVEGKPTKKGGGKNKEKSLDKLNDSELNDLYVQLYGAAPDATDTREIIIGLIQEMQSK